MARLESYVSQLHCSDDDDKGKCEKLCYWITDWVNFLEHEKSFSPNSLCRYKRGQIIKVHLGFNLGSEQGGLHYAVVLDKNSHQSSQTITIVPLASSLGKRIYPGRVDLGNELYVNLSSKLSSLQTATTQKIADLQSLITEMTEASSDADNDKLNSLMTLIDEANQHRQRIQKIRQEIQKMNQGSIALVNQITTISKLRIYDPKINKDVLGGIKLSDEKLDLLDAEISNLFIRVTE